jgi:hypothetical protein
MSSLSGRTNIVRVNIECFTGCNKIKQRRIAFVLGYLRMIHVLWKISTAISMKNRILATFNVKKSILTACMPLTCVISSIRRCLILLHPVKHSIFTRTIFVRPDSELIRESVYTCAKLFVDEETVHMAQIELWKNKNIEGFYTKTTQKGGFSKFCVKVKKRC